MIDSEPTLDQWRRLYAVMADVKALAPWNWMKEGDLFAVQDPATGQLGYVSVMGAIGEHLAVAVYLGGAGLRGFIAMQDAGESADEEQLRDLFFAIPQLQASSEDRDLLDPDDLATIKKLGLKFRGRNAWPLFRSYRPGYVPWRLTADEAAYLTFVLEQVLNVAPRFRDDRSLFYGQKASGMLVRALAADTPGAGWEDRRQSELPLESEPFHVEVDLRLLDKLGALPVGKNSVEIDLFMLPAPIQEGKGRPFFGYNLLFVDADSGFILGFEMLRVETLYEAMWANVPKLVLQQLLKNNTKPRAIKIRPGSMAELLKPVADYCGIAIKQSQRLQMLDVVRQSLLQTMF